MASMAVGEEFAGAGQADGLELWRIENKIPVKKTAEEARAGKFHMGDSYILLRTIVATAGTTWNLHFWLGSETSQDESGIAAYKTVELDESLGGGPVQYREVQGHESDLFLSYFRDSGVEYLEGGVESGFVHVDRDSYRTRLLHVKGKRVVRCNEVPCESASLNTGDCFILDMGMSLFVYNGANANRKEKTKAAQMVQHIRNEERGARANIIIMDEEPNNAQFWEALGGQIEVTNPGEDDESAEARAHANTALYRISDASGSLEVTEVPKDDQGHLQRSMLDTNDCFLIDADSEIYVWVGRGATAAEKRESMIHAQTYLGQAGKPAFTPVSRVVEGAETPVFKGLFFQWTPPRRVDFSAPASSGVAARQEQKEIDFGALHAGQAEPEPMIDDGSGTTQVWRIENFEKADWPADKVGQFYQGDSYVILYTYQKDGRDAWVIYFWLGKDSSTDEKGAAALQAKDLDDSMGGEPIQVRVVQGKEDAHFRTLFHGHMVVHSGGMASGFKNRDDGDSYDTDGISLFHVKGTNANNTYAVQVDERAQNLNGGDCFVLLTPTTMYVWQGNGASDSEKEVAANVAELLRTHGDVADRQVVTVVEGQEDEAFWTALGGQAEYPSFPFGEEPPREARLFQCSNATGTFSVDEIFGFDQEDLCDEDVMLLDTYSSVYLWVGSQANQQEKSMAFDAAQAYIAAAGDGRDADTPVVRINPGNEPPAFTMHFRGWDPELTQKNKFIDPYEARLAAMRAARGEDEPEPAAAPEPTAAELAAAAGGAYEAFSTKIAYEDIKAGSHSYNIDPANKQEYLSDAEFSTVFSMDRAAFGALAGWKQAAAKKTAGLF